MYLYRYDPKIGFEMIDNHPIYPDRIFDNIVSKYKKPVLAHLKQFSDANNSKSTFNGFGSYNLGIMIYGLPGTGKTSFMKALCNHVGRDGYVYDMRTVRTNSQFRDMFRDIKSRVYIFDEFDCIQGVVNREHNEESETTNNDQKRELKDKLLSLLSIQHKESKETQNITKEIEAVKMELKQLDEALNLETLLTVLDGPFEMRNRIIVAATNYIDRIDPALLRPGRFDLKIKLEEFNDEETIELLEKMFAGDDYVEYIKNHKFKRLTPTNIINICHELHDLRKVLKAISLGPLRSPEPPACYCNN
jgi:SpoVK/Ycf46/Vps4 family AAA+-type ATPase